MELAERGGLDYLVFECLAERTIALAQQVRMKDPEAGFDPLLAKRMRAVLPICAKNKVKVVTNMGAANPAAAAEATREIARKLGLEQLKVAAAIGDDVLAYLHDHDVTLDNGRTIAALGASVISANAYIGVTPIVEALKDGADVVITGRAADPAIFMAPLIVEFGSPMNDWTLLGRGTLCRSPARMRGPGHWRLLRRSRSEGRPRSRPALLPDWRGPRRRRARRHQGLKGSGGAVTATKEQLLYEIHDPKAYLQPEVIADFSEVRVEEIGPDHVRVTGGKGAPKTGLTKTSVGYVDSYVGEGQISYAGPNAVARARLALDIVRERLALTGVRTTETRFDLIGIDSLHGEARMGDGDPYEVRIRVVGRTLSLAEARRIGEEVETLYTNEPAAGGGAWKSARQVAVASALIPETAVRTAVTMLEAS